MQLHQFLAVAVAVAFNAREAVAVTHGELSEYDGKAVRWQQLAEGVFTGVPEDEWDEKHHKRYNVEWDVDEIVARSDISTPTDSPLLESRDLSLEARTLKTQCKAVGSCIIGGSQWALYQGVNTWISLADYAKNGHPGKDLMEFLNQPFVANAAGVAIAGVISGQINEATKKECSTEPADQSQADIIKAALEAVLSTHLQAGQVAVDIEGPSGTISIKVKSGPPDTSPNIVC